MTADDAFTFLLLLTFVTLFFFYRQPPSLRWFRFTQQPGDDQWNDVVRVLTSDPILTDKKPDVWPHALPWILAAFTALGWLWLIHPKMLPLIYFRSPVLMIGALLVALAVLQGLRTRLQSESRERWVAELRDELALFMAHLQELYTHGDSMQQNRRDMERARMKIELLIDPSAPLHRTLTLLLRVANGTRPVNAIDGPVLKRLKALELPAATPISALRWHNSAAPQHDQLLVLQVYIQRIANVLLHHAWEPKA